MKKKIHAATLATLFGLAVILTSWEHFDHRPMAALEALVPAFSREGRGLHVTAKKYTSAESKEYLDRNLPRYGYHPIQITIQNNTPDSYVLSKEGVSMPFASADKMAKILTKKGLARSLGLKIASFFFWPFMVPSTLDGIYTLKTHRAIRKDYSAKVVREEAEEIAPYSTLHRVIFVPEKELRETLTITLLTKEKDGAFSFVSTIEALEEKSALEPVE